MKRKTKERVSLNKVAETCGGTINGQSFLNDARQRPEDFTRNRKLPFPLLMLFMLNTIKSSIQTCLNKFFELIGQDEVSMTQQAFSEARKKIKWQAFQYLFKSLVALIYTGYFSTWRGYRLSAIDGTKVQLPDEQKLRDYYGTVGKGNTAATAQGSTLYDMLNNVILDAQIEPIGTDERTLAVTHIDELCAMPSFDKECIIFDRGYASFELINTLKGRNISFVMRVRRKFNVSIDLLEEGDHHCVILSKNGYDDIPVRVIKFTLPSGEEETLITDIVDTGLGIQDFKELYFMRWPIETKYDEIKNKLEVENFSGRTTDAIKQDFFISMYLSNVMAVARWEAQDDIDAAREDKDSKYSYHVNANHAVGVFKDRFFLAVLEPNRRQRNKRIKRILFLMTGNPAPTRPDRSLPRNPSPRKAKFRHNRKSNC